MARSRPSLLVAGSLVSLAALVAAGCDVPVVTRGGPAPAAQPTVMARTSTSQSRPTVDVRRGTITDSIKVLGRVISSQEADLYFKRTARLRGIFVESGQQVKAGQLLAEQETGDLLTNIGKARASVENAQIKLDQARAKGVVDETSDEAVAVDVAQLNAEQARLALEKLRAGPQEADVKTAEAAVIKAVSDLEKARVDLAQKESELAAKRADLAAKLAGPAPTDLAAAQAAVDTARIKLQQVQAGPRPEEVQAAELKLDQARTKLAQLRDAPPVRLEDIENAELVVKVAETKLDQARADTAGTPAQREARVRAAELDLEVAKNKLSALRNQQVSPWDVRLAEQAVAAAENDLAKLRNPAPFDARTAQVNYDLAVAKLQQLQQGPLEEDLAGLRGQIASLEIAVESARLVIPSAEAAVAAAQASLDAKLRGATEFEIREQESKLEKALLDVETARARVGIERAKLGASRAATTFDLQVLQKDVEKAQLDLEQLQQTYEDSRIVAPFDGKITKINGKPGDNVQAFNPVISISSPAQLLVQAQINEADMPKLAVGQRALITLDAMPGVVINGTVRDLPSTIVTQQGVVADKNTKIVVDWPRPGAEIGMLTRVQIIVQKKDDVLIVPTNAIRTVGKRRFVEYMDGSVKRSRNVEIGISTDVDTEIVSGLDEGMQILAGT
jgi:HlyD family secretion protein